MWEQVLVVKIKDITANKLKCASVTSLEPQARYGAGRANRAASDPPVARPAQEEEPHAAENLPFNPHRPRCPQLGLKREEGQENDQKQAKGRNTPP